MFGLVFQRALVKQVDYLIKNFKEEKGKNYIEYLASCPAATALSEVYSVSWHSSQF